MRFEWTNTLPHENALFWGLRDEGFNWHTLQRFICRVSIADQTCARQERDLRAFAKKAGYKVVGVWKGNSSGAKQEVLALAQARKIDVILVTELTRWGRSARIAARSLTCFKFRFVSSPQERQERAVLAGERLENALFQAGR